jgi:penicillin-binding protein 1C
MLDSTFPITANPSYSTLIYDKEHVLLNAYLNDEDKWRMPCRLDEANDLFIKTLLQKEDKYFYVHPGVNPFAIARAAFKNIISNQRTSGASTITMQVVRLLEPRQRTFSSKIIEFFKALQLELKYSKQEILQLYLSLAPYGSNIEGIKSASFIYFGKAPALLSPAEAVLLTIIPNRPYSLKPGKNNELLLAERNRWLRRMEKEKLISKTELLDAINEPINIRRKTINSITPHLARRLKSMNPKVDVINTTIDSKIQLKVQKLCRNHSERLSALNIHNGCVIVVENSTGNVISYVGSQDFEDGTHQGQVDGITAIRSPGSTLKPLVYAMGFDKGIITPKAIVHDVPVNYAGYSPENFNQRFNGKVTVEDALSYSLNIPAVQMLDQVTVPLFTKKLIGCGFKSIEQQKYLGLSSILGGCGVTLEELAGLYSMFANDGKFKVLNYVEASNKKNKIQILSEEAAFLLTTILTRADRPDLPNLFESSLHTPKVAWKTGTSYGRRDAWSIGFNKKYTVGVWVGNFDGTGIPELTGSEMATPLLFSVFNSIDYNSSNEWYNATSGIDYHYVCSASGLVPGDFCTDKIIDTYIAGVSKNIVCNHIIEVTVNSTETISYCSACAPAVGYKKIKYPNIAPELLQFYRLHQIPTKEPPPHLATCTRIFDGKAPKIISLQNGQEYLIEKEEPKKLVLSCASSADVKEVFWYINNVFLQKCQSAESTFFIPENGSHKISCCDDKGRNTDIHIMVTYY